MLFSTGVNESVFILSSATIKFGPGASSEVGHDLKSLGARSVLLVTDKNLVKSGVAQKVAGRIESEGLAVDLFDGVRIEPTDKSMLEAVEYARGRSFDAIVAVGGGSVIDTAKAVNLLTTYPADLLDYVNKPIGAGKPVPGPLKPLIAVATTAGSGSENTPVIVLDLEEQGVKTGISHPYIRPILAVADPELTVTMPPMVTASTGLDVLSHAMEAYTSKPFYARPRPATPAQRGAYGGSNPVTDAFAEKAVELVSRYIRRAHSNPHDMEARYYMMLACELASSSFGNAGVHIPHANAYPIAGMARDYRPPDYQVEHPMIPHGLSVILTAPASFKYIAPASTEKVARLSSLLGHEPHSSNPKRVGETVEEALLSLMEDLGVPTSLKEVGFTEPDVPRLVEGALKQERLLTQSPRPVSRRELEKIFKDSMEY